MSAVVARYVEETVPFNLYANILPSLTMAQSSAGIVSSLLGLMLPPDDNHAALLATDKWKIMYFWFPLGLLIFWWLALVFTVR